MNSRKILLLIVAIAIGASTACNYSVDCWRRGEGSAGVGAGPGDSSGVGSSGSGDFGDDPGEQNNEEPLVCNKSEQKSKEDSSKEAPKSPIDPCQQNGAPSMGCTGVKPIDARAFNFVAIVAYDGTSVSGGWQEAKADLYFVHNIEGDAACIVRIGMPLRSEVWGNISADRAAVISADVANASARELYDHQGGEDLPPGIFCDRFKSEMRIRFDKECKGLGARMMSP
jgi:hypothetical protein